MSKFTRHGVTPPNPNYGTPPELVELIRKQLGGTIDLDPASSLRQNKTVRAKQIITEDAGPPCYQAWPGSTILLNPPGGQVLAFWTRLVGWYDDRRRRGLPAMAVWIGFSLEQFATLQDAERYPFSEFVTLVLRHRIKFIGDDDQPCKRPSHSNYLTLVARPEEQVFIPELLALGKVISR